MILSSWFNHNAVRGAFVIAWFALSSCLPVSASTFFENPDYLIANWLAADGVPEDAALGVAQTPEGFIWVGSRDGLLRFDGKEFTRCDQLFDCPELGAVVVALCTDHTGRLWVGTELGNVLIGYKGAWTNLELTNVWLRSVAEDNHGTVFLGTLDGQIYRYDNNKFSPAPAPAGMLQSGVFCARDEVDGGIWMANRGFIGRWNGSAWDKIGPAAPEHSSIVAGPAHGGGLWVYGSQSLRRYRQGSAPFEMAVSTVDAPRQVLEDHEGYIWLASNSRGLVRFSTNGASLSISASNGLAHNSSWCEIEDSEGDLWLGTSSGGLHRLRRRYFHSIGFQEGLPDRIARTVTLDGPGKILVGSHGAGMALIESNRVVWVQPEPITNGATHVWTLLRDRQGRLWVGTFGGGLFVEENGVERKVAVPHAMSAAINALMEDSRGRIWVGTIAGVGVIENGQFRVCKEADAVAAFSVQCFAEEPKTGAIWIGTYENGLFRLQDKKLARYGYDEGLPDLRIGALAFDGDGSLWIGTHGSGVLRLRDGKVSQVSSEEGLPAKAVVAILEDDLGYFWFGSDQGIIRVSKPDLYRAADGGSGAIFSIFNRGDGLENATSREGDQPTAVRDEAGHLWFATLNGVVTVDPRALRVNTKVPPVVIESFSYRDRDGARQTTYAPGGELELPAGATEVEVRCAALTFPAPEKARYAFRLEGADKEWTDLGNQSEIYLRQLPRGQFQLRIKAANNDGLWNETGAALNIVQRPFWWQTIWFRALAALALMGAAGGAAWRIQQNKLKERERQWVRERAQAEEKARLASVLEGTSDLVAFTSPSGSISYVNRAGRRLAGFAEKEDVTRLSLADLHPPEVVQLILRTAIPHAVRHGSWSGETTLQCRDGALLPISQVIVAHKDARNEFLFVSTIIRDMSGQRRLEDQLRQAQKMEAVGQLSGGIAHDFNNILSVIMGHVALLEMLPNLGGEAAESVAEIGRGAERAGNLTRQLLAFGRRQIIRSRPLDLNEAVTNVTAMLKRILGEDIEMVLQLRPGPLIVEADGGMLDQVMMNLAVNARDAMPRGGTLAIATREQVVSEELARSIPEGNPGRFACLTVTDTGCGMSDSVKAHLFEPFFTTKEPGKGTGLGLATVFGIVKQHGGMIRVESALQKGTAFHVFLPLSSSPHGQAAAEQSAPSPPAGGHETILLVEDDSALRNLTAVLLRQSGYKVFEAGSGVEALNLWERHAAEIQLVLTDMVMPAGMSGRELAEHLRADKPNVKIIFTSGYSAEMSGREITLSEGRNFVPKPSLPRQILATIRNCLDERDRA